MIVRDCFFHGRETAKRAFRVCFECDHIFKTARHLRRAHRRLMWTISFRAWLETFILDVEGIWSCPVCTHDW